MTALRATVRESCIAYVSASASPADRYNRLERAKRILAYLRHREIRAALYARQRRLMRAA